MEIIDILEYIGMLHGSLAVSFRLEKYLVIFFARL